MIFSLDRLLKLKCLEVEPILILFMCFSQVLYLAVFALSALMSMDRLYKSQCCVLRVCCFSLLGQHQLDEKYRWYMLINFENFSCYLCFKVCEIYSELGDRTSKIINDSLVYELWLICLLSFILRGL